MPEVLLRLAWRLVLCAAFTALAWAMFRNLGAIAGSAVIYGVLLARPLLDLASELRHGMRAAVWRPVEGRHYVYRGTPVQVIEDEDHTRWVRAADVRTIVGFTAGDAALALTYPDGWRPLGRPPQPHFSDEVLLTHLRKESTAEAGRFLVWAERTITLPARRLRERRRD